MKRIFPVLSLIVALATSARAEPIPLDALVERIIATHPELKFYEAELAAARAGVRAASTRADPGLSLELGRRRVTGADGLLASEGAAWSASISQSFPWPGRLALRQAVANRDVALAELGLGRFRAALDARARTLAFGLHAAIEQAAAIAEVAGRFAELKRTLLAREPAGITPLLETRVLEAAELALQRRATEATLAADRARVEFNQLRGEPAEAPLDLAAPSVVFATSPDVVTLLAAARERNFVYLARKLELERQRDAVQLARHEARPDFTVAPFYSQAKAGEREANYGVGVSMSLPFGASRRSAAEIARAREQQAAAALQLAERELERDVLATAHEFAAKAAEVNRWQSASLASFREAAELADRHYRLGAVPIATFVELQKSYLDAVEALLETQRETIAAGLRLQELTGTDFNAVRLAP
jgi:cobalt-zinc-cadmium efflux system outer membrane protein